MDSVPHWSMGIHVLALWDIKENIVKVRVILIRNLPYKGCGLPNKVIESNVLPKFQSRKVFKNCVIVNVNFTYTTKFGLTKIRKKSV